MRSSSETTRPALPAGRESGCGEVATRPVVVFLDSDAIPTDGWGAGLERALREFPHSLIGCARTFDSKTAWGWVAHLQAETPYLPLGEPRNVPFLSSYCVAAPRDVPFAGTRATAARTASSAPRRRAAGYALVFDPRFHAHHDHDRETWADLRRQQRRTAYGIVRTRRVVDEGRARGLFARVPDPSLRALAPAGHLPAPRDRARAQAPLRPIPAEAGRRRVDAGRKRSPLRALPTRRAGGSQGGASLSGRPSETTVGDLTVRRVGLGTMSLTGRGTRGDPRNGRRPRTPAARCRPRSPAFRHRGLLRP